MFASLCLLVGATPAAFADAGAEIMERCAQGQSVAGFTVEQYQQALKSVTTEEIEYHGECVEVIERAEQAAASHRHAGAGGASADERGPDSGSATGGSRGGGRPGGGSPNAGGPVEPTAAQARILEATRDGRAPAVRLGDGDEAVSPGLVHPDLAPAASDLPATVQAVIAAVIAGILLLAGHELRRRMRRPRLG